MKFRPLFVAAALASLFGASSGASAQSACPYIAYGAVLTAGQWNQCFANKQDALGYNPVNKAGDVMLGKLVMTTSTPSSAGINLPQGSAPTNPANGDLWTTLSGMFVRINGATVGPLASANSATFAATAPITVAFPAGVVTYGFNFGTANTWTATQTFGNVILSSGASSAWLNTDTSNAGFVVNTTTASAADFWFSGAVGVGVSLRARSNALIGWTNGSSAVAAPDVAFSRDSAGVLDLGTGAFGNKSGALNLAALTASGVITAAGVIAGNYQTTNNTGYIQFGNSTFIQNESDGVIAFFNNAGTSFGRLQLGGTTASFPSIKRNATGINIRLADDSADAPLTASALTATGGLITGTNGSSTLTLGTDITLSNGSGSRVIDLVESSSGFVNVVTAGGLGFPAGTGDTAPDAMISRGGVGILTLSNSARTSFGRLQFGGTTASFPSIKRSGAGLAFRVADDTADAALTAGAANFSGAAVAPIFQSTVTTGTAPLVVASTTLVSNLYSQRALLADTVTTNANLTGDVTSVGNATTLATVNANVGLFGSATQVGQFTVNAKGLVTQAAAITVTPAVTALTGLGTGIATALGINIGSAGAPVLFNGAGGTPSSMTLTNATGLPNAGLVNSSTTVNGQVCALGGACTITASAGSITAGVTTVTGGPGILSNTTSGGVLVSSTTLPNGLAMGTPASLTLTSATGLPISTGVSGLGTGVATALGVNVGTAGSIVVNGGALGTPSSGVATNLTGTAAGLTAGTVTTNANLTGDVTSVGNATTLATVNGAGCTPGSATTSAVLTINAKGLTTSCSQATIAPAVGSVTGLGTGVATALAVNVGTAGAFVTLNGAGGTPSSMTATNLTGTAAGLTAGAVPASGITGTTLAASVITSSLTTVGALGAGSATTGFTISAANVTLSGQFPGSGVASAANASGSPSATFGVVKCDGSTITCSSGVISAVGGVATSVQVGATTITSGTNNNILTTGTGVLSNVTIASLLTQGNGILVTGTTNAGIAVDKATAANFLAATSNKVLTADNVFTSETTTTFSTTPTFDFSTFFNTAITLTNNITSITCSNQKAAQSGAMRFIQDATGSRTLPATFGCNMKFSGGIQPVLSTAPSAVDVLVYSCSATNYCVGALIKGASWLYVPGVFGPRGWPANDNALLRMTG